MPVTLSNLIQEIEYWLRLGTFLHEPLKEALLYVLHNKGNDQSYNGLPTVPTDLYQELDQIHRTTLNRLHPRVIQQDQLDLIFPPGKTETDSSKFDATLIVILIRNCLKLPLPANGWNDKYPPSADQSIAANSIRAREWRNVYHHTEPKDIDEPKFEQKWQEGVDIINALGFNYDTKALKEACLDPMRFSVLQSLMCYHGKRQDYAEKDAQNNYSLLWDNIKSMSDVIKTNEYNLSVLKARNEERSQEGKNRLVLPKVLVVISQHIGEDWKKLALFLEISGNIIEEIDNEIDLSNEDKMMKCFDDKHRCFVWDNLKLQLRLLGKTDLIDTLRKNTLLTLGLQEAHIKLKKQYILELMNWMMEETVIGDGGKVKAVLREEAFIDIGIINAADMDKEWRRSDREHHMRQTYFERTNITMEDIIKQDDELVIVRGIAGIGKTSMVDLYVLKWANAQILTGANESPKIDFLFKLTCRDLNTYRDINSAADILSVKYRSIFDIITMSDLSEMAGRVLITIDGLDELRSVNSLKNISTVNADNDELLAKSVYDLIDVKSDFLSGHKTIVAARPEACAILSSVFRRQLCLKTIELCGFNSESINSYIEMFFGRDEILAADVKQKVSESENLTVMTSIPVYLWVICCMFKDNEMTETPKTTTQLSSLSNAIIQSLEKNENCNLTSFHVRL